VREEVPTCREVVELVTNYLEGQRAPGDRERFEMHLAICEPCVTHLEQMRLTIGAAGALDDSTIPDHQLDGLVAAFRALFARRATGSCARAGSTR
jgi:anti-sigma factor RsiW